MAPLNSDFPLLICSTELVLSLGIMSMSNLQRLLHAISKAELEWGPSFDLTILGALGSGIVLGSCHSREMGVCSYWQF